MFASKLKAGLACAAVLFAGAFAGWQSHRPNGRSRRAADSASADAKISPFADCESDLSCLGTEAVTARAGIPTIPGRMASSIGRK